MNTRCFKFEDDLFSKNAQGISKSCQNVFLLKKFYKLRLGLRN